MAGWRAKLAGMRDVVHSTFRVPAIYLTHTAGEPLRVNVRDHTKFKEMQISGAGAGFADMQDVTPRLVFDQGEVGNPLTKAYVAMGPDEIYVLGSSRPPAGGYVEVEAAPVSAAQRAIIWQPAWADLL